MIKLLSLILFILLLFIGDKRGVKTFITIYLNIFLLLVLILLICHGYNPIICSLIICLIISVLILFFLNGINRKTISSFISVIIILILFSIITFCISKKIYIQGFSDESIEGLYVTYNVGLDMINIANAVIIIGLIGTIIDTSIAISSALFEVHQNNPNLSKKELFYSGINIGKDILGTTTNTLFFAYLGSSMALLILFQDVKYGISTIINSKIFAQEFFNIVLSAIASILIIPLTSLITSKMCKKSS